MANITISFDEEVITKVRRIAAYRNTTLTGMVRDFLQSVVERDASQRQEAARRVRQSFAELSRDMGARRWKRDELHGR